jgi:hypothetical protein
VISAPRRIPQLLVVTLLFAGLTVLFTQPLALHLATRHVGESGGDARVYLWNLWWVKTALTRLHTNPLQTDFIFFPTGVGLALHTLALAQGLLFIPLSAVVGDVVGANLIVLSTFLASSLGAYALARRVGAQPEGAFLAGLIFAFCPYRLARLAGHYDLLGTEWIPLYALAFLNVLDAERPRWWVVVAGFLGGVCGYTDLTYLVFLVVVSVVLLAFRRPWGDGRSPWRVGGVAALVALALSPLLLSAWSDVHAWRYPPYPGSDRYVADLLGYVTPGPRQTILGGSLGRTFDPNVTETTVFAGWLTVAIAATALRSRETRRALAPWLVLGGLAVVLSLGDTLHVAGQDTGLPLLFPWLRSLPVLHHLRAPSRFSILVMLVLALLASTAWTRRMASLGSARWRFGLTALVAGGIVAETLAIPIPLFAAGAPPLYAAIGREAGDFTVVEVPGIDQVPGQVMYHQTIHGKRIFIGTAARVPVEKTSYFFGLPLVRPLVDLRKGKVSLSDALGADVTGPAPEAARFLGIRYFVIERAYESRGIVRFLEAALPTERAAGDADHIVLRVRSEDLPPVPTELDPGSSSSRLYFESGWSPPEGEAGHRDRRVSGLRSTLLFRRPTATLDVVLELRPPGDREEVRLEGRLRGTRLGTSLLHAGTTEVRWTLPPGAESGVERVELAWSVPGAQIATVRLEPGR